MNTEQARRLVIRAIREVAPDADVEALPPEADLREDLALDSMDFLSLVEILSERGGIRIEEDDYPRLATVDGCVMFLAATGADRPAARSGGPRA